MHMQACEACAAACAGHEEPPVCMRLALLCMMGGFEQPLLLTEATLELMQP